MDNDGGAIFRTLGWRLIRLPKHPVLQPRRLMSSYERRANREERSLVRHVRVVPHEQPVLVTLAEPRSRQTGVDAYAAIICIVASSRQRTYSHSCTRGSHLRGNAPLLALGSMCRE